MPHKGSPPLFPLREHIERPLELGYFAANKVDVNLWLSSRFEVLFFFIRANSDRFSMQVQEKFDLASKNLIAFRSSTLNLYFRI